MPLLPLPLLRRHFRHVITAAAMPPREPTPCRHAAATPFSLMRPLYAVPMIV